jgi:hypothetical protein
MTFSTNRLAFSCIIVFFATVTRADTIINAPPTSFPAGPASFQIPSATTLNIYNGAVIQQELGANSGSTINMYGGELFQPVTAKSGSTINIYDGALVGGNLGDFTMMSGSQTTIRGGRITSHVTKQSAASLVIDGVDFAIGGIPVAGLLQLGDQTSVSIPQETLFTGIFANGAPFTFFNSNVTADQFAGQITLRQTERPTGPAIVTLPNDPAPPGVLPGQTLVIENGGSSLNGMNAAPGSFVDVQGGHLSNFEAYGAVAHISGGTSSVVNAYQGARIQYSGGDNGQLMTRVGSHADISGGTIDAIYTYPGAELNINGGSVGLIHYNGAAEVSVHGGEVLHLDLATNAKFHLSGGFVSGLSMTSGVRADISGGSVGTNEYAAISASSGSDLTLFGIQFLLDGASIAGLTAPGSSVIIPNRNGEILQAFLADGTLMKLYMDDVLIPPSAGGTPRSVFANGAIVRLVLVPEASTATLAIAGLLPMLGFQRRKRTFVR